jgi:hypothetical protein
MYNNDKPTAADKEAFEAIALWAAQRGLTLTVHWGNDASVGQLLDVFDHVNVQLPIAPLRWSIAHLNDASFETLTRMKNLGVGWTMQDAMYFNGDATIRQRGPAARRIPPSKPPASLASSSAPGPTRIASPPTIRSPVCSGSSTARPSRASRCARRRSVRRARMRCGCIPAAARGSRTRTIGAARWRWGSSPTWRC